MFYKSERQDCSLVLEDGTVFTGFRFGANTEVDGEVVFQTGLVGYPESLTDPSYHAQILLLTYPLIGNYGVPSDGRDEFGLPSKFESHKIWASGLIVSEICDTPSHWQQKMQLSDWLSVHNVPGISDIDTRQLTKHIREHGSMLGRIVSGIVNGLSRYVFTDPNERNLVKEVSIKSVTSYVPPNGNAVLRVCVIDFGLKYNQLRCLLRRNVAVDVVPWNQELPLGKYDGYFLSNGPGDPSQCSVPIQQIRKVIAANKFPVFGICLGHQLLSVAAGCTTYKMKYGNRGHNQPCLHHGTERCFITSQNHGYAVDATKLPDGWLPLFTNANDNSNEGIVHKSLPFFR